MQCWTRRFSESRRQIPNTNTPEKSRTRICWQNVLWWQVWYILGYVRVFLSAHPHHYLVIFEQVQPRLFIVKTDDGATEHRSSCHVNFTQVNFRKERADPRLQFVASMQQGKTDSVTSPEILISPTATKTSNNNN